MTDKTWEHIPITALLLAVSLAGIVHARESLPVTIFDNLISGKHQAVVVYGTSLSHKAEWPKALERYFKDQFPRQVSIHNSAMSGRPSNWGLENLQTLVLDKNPDLVFIEFSMNDAATKHGISVEQGIENLDRMVRQLREQNPRIDIVLQTMNPSWDTHQAPGTTAASDRPDLLDYYESYREYAHEHGVPLIDHYRNWVALREENEQQFRKWLPDGTHPVPEGSLAVTWPAIETLLERAHRTAVLSVTTFDIWPEGKMPGPSVSKPERPHAPERTDATRITNVSRPTLTLYPAVNRSGPAPAVIVCPGGGYSYVVVDKEGSEVAEWLNSIGLSALVLKYRVPNNRAGALQDIQRALSLSRTRAMEWNIDPGRLGVMGFSAGGNLCAKASTRFGERTYPAIDAVDAQSCRPDFAVLVYPAYLERDGRIADDLNMEANIPPTLIVHTEDDRKLVPGSKVYAAALEKRDVPHEFLLYPTGGHGYGLRCTGDARVWPRDAAKWLGRVTGKNEDEGRLTVALIGDSTVTDSAGWGKAFAGRFGDDVRVLNFAVGGRSSKSWYEEDRLPAVLEAKPDYVLIQFGHNGQPGKGPGRETDPDTTYRDFLRLYVKEFRAIGAKPVILSSVTRRRFDEAGRIQSTLTPWARAAGAVAQEMNVPFIGLHSASLAYHNRIGREASMAFNPRQDDLTHFNAKGAEAITDLIMNELTQAAPDLASRAQAGDEQPTGKSDQFRRLDMKPARAFWFGGRTTPDGYVCVAPQDDYAADKGYGWLKGRHNLFGVKLPEGNYDVAVTYGDPSAAASAIVKAESRRLMLMPRGKMESPVRRFTVNVRRPEFEGGGRVHLRRPEDAQSYTWDDRLSLEFFPGVDSVVSLEIRPAHEAVTIYLAGDSTVTDQTEAPWAGWGQMLPRFFGPGVAVANHAESGRALYSFRWEKRLDKILSTLREGDYLFIQFGHNDQKNKREGAGPFTTYSEDLGDFITRVRKKRAFPVLVTPMERRRWSGAEPGQTLTEFAEAVRLVGKERNVPVIDLHAMSLKLYTALGPEGSKRAFVHYPANTFSGQDKPLKDDTHHTTYGAYELARCIVEGVKAHVPGLAEYLRSDTESFDPSKPDNPDRLGIPASRIVDIEKPEGN